MTDGSRISSHIQMRLRRAGVSEISAVDAAQWLDRDGVLEDSPHRPGKPLRDLLRQGLIANAEQRPPRANGRWFIRLGDSAGPTRTASAVGIGSGEMGEAPPVAPPRSARAADGPDRSTGDGEPLSVEWLRGQGFQGFVRFHGIDLSTVPQVAGVYVVIRESADFPKFLDVNPGG